MPTSFSKGPPLRFHLDLPTDDNDEDVRDRIVAVRASERLASERLRQGLPVHCAKVENVLEKMRRLTEEMARL